MNLLDIIIAIIVVLFGISGLRKGLIREAATLLGLFLGLYVAFHFSDFTADKLQHLWEIDPKYLNLIAFIVTFIVVSILVNLLGRLVARLVKAINLGFLDRLGGFVVGAAKGILICSLLIMLLNVFDDQKILKDETKQKSRLYPYVEQTVPFVYQGFDLVKEAMGEWEMPDISLPFNKPETAIDSIPETDTVPLLDSI
ncbi:MAG: CvpA family protein [Bacteroidales bacterium]|nr:CvpA family protein [Bacteroidales bacterium]MBR6273322.1 CvpA family protein [Bacteroidales bacterium]